MSIKIIITWNNASGFTFYAIPNVDLYMFHYNIEFPIPRDKKIIVLPLLNSS